MCAPRPGPASVSGSPASPSRCAVSASGRGSSRQPDRGSVRPAPRARARGSRSSRSEEHTSELQSRLHLVCRLLLEKKKNRTALQWRLALVSYRLLDKSQVGPDMTTTAELSSPAPTANSDPHSRHSPAQHSSYHATT